MCLRLFCKAKSDPVKKKPVEGPKSPKDLNFIIDIPIASSKHTIYLCHGADNQKYIAKVFAKDDKKKNDKLYLNEKRFFYFNHPNIINYVFYEDDKLFIEGDRVREASIIYMEYAPYGDLFKAKIVKKIPFSEKLIRTYFR
mmetsp:Transcript_6135/g.5491  ORF Transcript_6135/g.5491 Transcript_6135/m.5491 type:complete len:141 (+) Transcript_6135:110-532(+)|eukprot:CAMPEP_0114582926 /NCGR_PEP_ID=MMETSP0125-20121206/6782_1 /TAXON_ID=485358 ORGANISM="Aristerostoma sp., Strain ATCC 50986" /NCGR_SAMPLE_ID=MMETSP0125 /ASSEMBLY_ACC=CAM_ASM_000245 /LENGTH=140 /DNA_ID=CAMNT_0001776117 /DNA_START=42 /DNA_END=464 /DNA_ORIENTATION=+